MNALEKRLVHNYTVLVMGKVIALDDVPDRKIIMNDGTESTLKDQVEIEKAKREIEILENM